MPAGVNDSHTLNTLSSDIPVTVTDLRFVIADSHAGIELEDSGGLRTSNSQLYLEGTGPKGPDSHSTPSRVDSIEDVVFNEDILLDSTEISGESVANLSGFIVYTLSSPELTQPVYLKDEVQTLGSLDNSFGVRSMESNDPRDIVSSFSPSRSVLSVSSGDELQGILQGSGLERVRSWLQAVGVSSVAGVEKVSQLGPIVSGLLFVSMFLVFPMNRLAGVFLLVLLVVSFVLSLPQNYTGKISLSDPVDKESAESIVISSSDVCSETVETVHVEQEENRLLFRSTESEEYWVVEEEVLLGESALSVMYDIGFENVDTDSPVEIIVSDSPQSESSVRVRNSKSLTWWVRSAETEKIPSV